MPVALERFLRIRRHQLCLTERTTAPSVPEDVTPQLQPLVLPQLGQAWQEPARCIWTPHCMQ